MSDLPPTELQPPGIDPGRWVDDHGDCLYRFALARVRKTDLAEDLVQETLLAGIKAVSSFSGRSAERTWLVGILKNKIADHFRKAGRETSFTDMEFLKDEMSHRFNNGFWDHDAGPKDWTQSDEVTYKSEFWDVMRACLAKLPPRVANVFMMRQMDEADLPDICETLQITPNNVWVTLHRARMALRECLEIHWFGKTPG